MCYIQKLGDDGGRRHFDEDDVVEADAIERVEQREAALDLVRFDHALEDVLDGDMLALAREMVCDGENGAQIVGRVAPWNKKVACQLGGWGEERAERTFCGKEAIVKVEPTNDGTDVEGSANRIELVVRPRHLGPWHGG